MIEIERKFLVKNSDFLKDSVVQRLCAVPMLKLAQNLIKR